MSDGKESPTARACYSRYQKVLKPKSSITEDLKLLDPLWTTTLLLTQDEYTIELLEENNRLLNALYKGWEIKV